MLTSKLYLNAGRSLLALYFLIPGLLKFVAWDTHIALMESHHMVLVPVLLFAAASLQIACSLALLFNRYVAWSAMVLAVMVLLINVNLHDFWNYSDIQGKHELQNFIKNLGIFAGLLLLLGISRAESQAKKDDDRVLS